MACTQGGCTVVFVHGDYVMHITLSRVKMEAAINCCDFLVNGTNNVVCLFPDLMIWLVCETVDNFLLQPRARKHIVVMIVSHRSSTTTRPSHD